MGCFEVRITDATRESDATCFPGNTASSAMSWLGVARVLREHTSQINSLDFSKDGELLLSSGDDARLCLYSTTQGVPQRVAVCAQHGAALARFTHDPMSVIVASPTDHSVRITHASPSLPPPPH